MFWNKTNLEEKKEETIENRIIDLLKLNSSKIDIWYNRYYKSLSSDKWFKECWTLNINSKWIIFCIWYMQEYSGEENIFLFEDSNNTNDVELDVNKADEIKNTAEEKIKRDFIKKLFPVDPDITKMMSDVEEIQDSKEQIDFILKRIQWIKEKY